MTAKATDYHKRPVLSARIDADLKAFAVAEAKRPGMTLGSVVDEALADLRAKRMVNHVVCSHRIQPGAYCKTCGTAKPKESQP